MVSKKEEIAGMIGRNRDIVDLLDNLLTGCDDRAYIICSAAECGNNKQGRCSIHTVTGSRDNRNNDRCRDYLV